MYQPARRVKIIADVYTPFSNTNINGRYGWVYYEDGMYWFSFEKTFAHGGLGLQRREFEYVEGA